MYGHAAFATIANPASLGNPYRLVNSMLGQLHAERVAAGARPTWHEGSPVLDAGSLLDIDDDL